MPTSLSPVKKIANPKQHLIDTLKVMYRSRYADEKMMKLVRQNKGGTFHISVHGHELIGAVSALALTPEKDWGLPYYRDRTFAIGLGSSLKDLFGAFLARSVPHHSGGRMMPEHFSHKKLRIPCQSSCVGSQFLHAVGVAKAAKLSDTDEVVYVSAGEGATSQGDFHEALNFSCLHELSVIFVIQDNGWAISVPRHEQTAGGSIAKMARGYEGLAVFQVDGGDYEQTSKALRLAVEKGRNGKGPSLIIAQVPRLGPHSSSDDPQKYKATEIVEREKAMDPLPRFEKWLLEMDILAKEDMLLIQEEIREEIEVAAKEAEAIPFPDKKTAGDLIFADVKSLSSAPERKEGEAIVMVDALNHALDEEMHRDESILIFGQDVAHGKGGVFGITRNLTAKYGSRCFNTPLAESTIIGIAIGMAMTGRYKPVAEIQFADYMWTGVNQLFNELASIHYRSNGEWNCPVVIRMPCGGYIQGGPYHSQSIEAFLAHCPGLKVVLPSNAADAKRLLKAAIHDPNPVIFLEHKALYRQRAFCARIEPEKDDFIPIGKAHIVQSGDDLTLVCWGMMVPMAFEIAQKLQDEGIFIEIIDARTIVPFDFKTVLHSVKKTGKVLIAHEASKHCGFGAEIAAKIAEEAFMDLDAPIKRIGALHASIPYCKQLEDAVLPQKEDLEAAIRDLIAF